MAHRDHLDSGQLRGVDGKTLHVMMEGVLHNFHTQVYELRAAFAALRHDDPERDAGILVGQLTDNAFHELQRTINVAVTAAAGAGAGTPLVLVVQDTPDGKEVVGVEVWEPTNPD